MDSQAVLDAPATAGGSAASGESVPAPRKALALCREWSPLPGQSVEVWLSGEYVAGGVVDQAAEDGTVLWIAAEGIMTRRIFDRASGYQVWL